MARTAKITAPVLTARQARRASRKAGATAATRINGVNADDSKIVAFEKAIAVAKSAGLPTRKVEKMLAEYKRANPEPVAKALKSVPNPDLITVVVPTQGGSGVYVGSAGEQSATFTGSQDNKATRALAVIGGSFAALQAHLKANPPIKPTAKLARGLDTQTAPHSAKAVADQKAVKSAAKAPKVAKAAKAIATDDKRTIKLLDKAYSYGADGTARNDSWLAARSAKTVAAYLAAGGKAKYLARFAAAGAIAIS